MNYGKNGVKKKQKALNARGGKFGRKLGFLIVKLVLAAIVGVGICGASLGLGVFRSILAGTPVISISQVIATGQATIVYDSEGNEIDEYVGSDSNRIEVTWDQVPKELGLAFVASEDERFYQHNGIDYKGMGRALYQYVKTGGDEAQGASTITQQLLKNTVFTTWTDEGDNKIKKIKRKIQEQYLALEVTKNTTKDEILIRYMNAINLGQNTLGVESASQRYFGKSAIDLNISECAVIASITQNPSKYNPLRNPDKNKVRRKNCLDKMLELEFITQEEYNEAIADTDAVYERISYHDTVLAEGNAAAGSYFSDAVYAQVQDDLIDAGYSPSVAEHMLNSGGLRIYTTMDPSIQRILDEEFQNESNFPSATRWYLTYALTIYDNSKEPHNYSKENMTTWFKENGSKNFNLVFKSQEAAYEAMDKFREAMFAELGVEPSDNNYEESISMTAQPQVAMVVEDQSTGYVVAMEGGRGVKEGKRTLNRATGAFRSPGSTFKVLASFAPALDASGRTLATVYSDLPFNYDDGTGVKNWYTGYGKYGTTCSIRTAVAQSLNIIAVKNLTCIGPRLGYDYLTQLGFTSITDGEVIGGQVFSDVNQTLALGGLTHGVSPFELNAGYAALANGGVYCKPKVYTLVTDSDDNVILDNRNPETRQVFKPTTAFLMTDAMKGVLTYGTGGKANFSGQALAGKTGTSSLNKDYWFVGYSPYYTAAVWTGFDNAIEMTDSNDSSISKLMWKSVMSRIHENLDYVDFPVPDGLVKVTVCAESGKLPSGDGCAAHLVQEYFAEGTEPTETCDRHYYGMICHYDGRIASEGCPFAYEGYTELPLVEEAPLVQGSTIINADGTVTNPTTDHYCMHDAMFYSNPDYQAILYQQEMEIQARDAAAAAAAAAAQEASGQ